MPQKAKKKVHPMPKLSLVDRLIYWTLMLLLFCFVLFIILFPFHIKEQQTYSDPLVCAGQGAISDLWIIVPSCSFFPVVIYYFVLPFVNRTPIFGRKNFKYGPPAWPRIYPLFMKNKPQVWVSQYEKQKKKKYAAGAAALLILGLLTFPLTFFGRECLRSDGSITQYNMFNKQTRFFSSEEITSIEIKTANTRHDVGVAIKLTTNTGRSYTFDNRNFRRNDPDIAYALRSMLSLKNQYDPNIITYKRTDRLDLVAFTYDLTAEETALLYQLFDVP